MRKGPGLSALSRHSATSSSYSTLSTSLSQTQMSSLQSSLEQFQDALTSFSAVHRQDIRRDPAFRHQFQKMCAAIGVDPFVGGGGKGSQARNGWWSDALGLGEWMNELCVQVVDVCVSTRGMNGGMIDLTDLKMRVERLRGGARAGGVAGLAVGRTTGGAGGETSGGARGSKATAPEASVSAHDILKAIDLLKPLKAGYTVVQIGSQTYVRTIPRELDDDQSTLLVLAADMGGRVDEESLKRQTGWGVVRARKVLDDCVTREGLGWVDEQSSDGAGRAIWIIAAVDWGDGDVSLT